MASVVSQLIEEVTAHAQRDSVNTWIRYESTSWSDKSLLFLHLQLDNLTTCNNNGMRWWT